MSLKLTGDPQELARNKVEGLLQHYGVKTHYVDLADNHWIALWMGLNQIERIKKIGEYYHYVEREIPVKCLVLGSVCWMLTFDKVLGIIW